MIEQLKLTNFRKHASFSVDFTAGLNAVKGGNELGKSTCYEAIAYAFYGSRALRESLAETVTWGQPENSLRVVLNFSFDGVRYNLYRAKSGCELTYDGGKVTGQSEVTKFIENLFQANAEIASRLMIAGQNELRGSLTAGPAATVELIEKLAGFSLMDEIIQKIQEQLPSGPTTVAVSRLETAEAALKAYEEPVKPILDPSFAQALASKESLAATLKENLASLDEVSALKKVQVAEKVESEIAALEFRKVQLMQALDEPLVTPSATPEQVQVWRVEAANANRAAQLYSIYTRAVPKAQASWEGGRESFDKAYAENIAKIRDLEARIQQVKLSRRDALLIKINEDSCAFCKKSLADVPEVAQLNAAQDQLVASIDEELSTLLPNLAALKEDSNFYSELGAVSDKIKSQFSEEYWDFADTVPPTPVWRGLPPSDPADASGLAKRIASAEAELKLYNAAQAVRESQRQELKALGEKLSQPVPDVKAERETLQKASNLKASVNAVAQEALQAKHAADLEQQRYDAGMQVYEASQGLRATLQAAVTAAHQDLTAISIHNELIKKIRAARPVVASSLWGSVLAAISHYFTEIRGEQSMVTRSPSGFKVNGRGTAGLSGSALDSLGLAIRLALTKTFLPAVDFLLLDEPAAACADDREINMLGVVASAGFEQVLLVTHSDLADSFAANLIQL